MEIKSICINNFRGLNNFEVTDMSENLLIIGKNDSGKSTLCYAIRKILDFNIRRITFNEADSSNSNKKDINIKLVLDVSKTSVENRSILGTFIDDDKTVTIELNAIFNNSTGYYDESLIYGSLDCANFATNVHTPIDKVLNIIYVDPNYNLDKDKKEYFRYRSIFDKENNSGLTEKVKEEINKLNLVISDEQVIKEINAELDNNELNYIFEDITFKAASNINTTNIYKSLEIIPSGKIGNINNIGDGKNKTLSLLLKLISIDSEKDKIIICEEPENHLYPRLQKVFLKIVSNIFNGQLIVTTHSNHIIDFSKMNKIIKLYKVKEEVKCTIANINNNMFNEFGQYFNEDFANMLFYDSVLLIEGYSEKYFYNRLMIDDSSFQKKCTDRHLGFFCVYGINFKPFKKILEELKIKVSIKTDNDIFKVQNSNPIKYRYAGIQRVLKCLDDDGKNKLKKLINKTTLTQKDFQFGNLEEKDKDIESHLEDICDLFSKYGIYISKHNDGFEKDFLEFYSGSYVKEDIDFLKEAKLNNLHKYIRDKHKPLKINENNKRSVLVRFIYV